MTSLAELLEPAVGQVWTSVDDSPPVRTASCAFVTIGGLEGHFVVAAAHSLFYQQKLLDPDQYEIRFRGDRVFDPEMLLCGDPPSAPKKPFQRLPDLALLKLLGKPPINLKPLRISPRLLDSTLQNGVPLFMCGTPLNLTSLSCLRFELSGEDSRTRTYQGSISADKGMSGGPVVLEDQPAELLGLISEISGERSADRTYITPIYRLAALAREGGRLDIVEALEERRAQLEPDCAGLCNLPRRFVDRELEIASIEGFLSPRRREYRALVIEGGIGSGKTTLVRHVINKVEEEDRFDRILCYRIPRTDHDPCRKAFFWLQQHLGASFAEIANRTDPEKAEAVTRGLEKANFLVVLDGVENLQSMDSETFGRIDHEGLRTVLATCSGWGKSRLILTTNLGLSGYEAPPVQVLQLGDLPDGVGPEYLRHLVDPAQKEIGRRWAKALGYQAGMLRVLAGYLGSLGKGEATLPQPPENGEPLSRFDAFAQLLEAYWETLTPGQHEFLQRLSTRADGAYEEELDRLLKSRPNVNVGRELTPQLQHWIQKLEDSPLIEIELHPGLRPLFRANSLCESFFVRKRGEAEGRVERARTAKVAETTARDRKWNPLRSIPSTRSPGPELKKIVQFLKERGCRSIVDYGCGYLRMTTDLCMEFEKVWATDFGMVKKQSKFKDALSEKLEEADHWEGFRSVEGLPLRKVKADAVLLAFVLHTIPSLEMRKEVLSKVRQCLLKAGKRLLVVITPRPKESYYRSGHESDVYEDGIMREWGKDEFTFYKQYRSEELQIFIESQGFHFVESGLRGDHKLVQVFEAAEEAATAVGWI